jgi:hypothetical protein
MTLYIIVLLTFLVHVGFAGSRLLVALFAVDQGATPLSSALSWRYTQRFPACSRSGRHMIDRLGIKGPMLFGTSGVSSR